MKRMSTKNNANKLFNNNIHYVRNSKQRKVLNSIKNDMQQYYRYYKTFNGEQKSN